MSEPGPLVTGEAGVLAGQDSCPGFIISGGCYPCKDVPRGSLKPPPTVFHPSRDTYSPQPGLLEDGWCLSLAPSLEILTKHLNESALEVC